MATQIWYPVWDERISLDHSVRTVRSAVGTAENDVRTGLTMLDARLVAGDAALLDELRERLARSLGRLARRWLLVLDDMTVTRHHRAGDVAFLLEPDLKDGKGGLRDAAALHAVGSLLEFIAVDDAVDAARDDLLSIRIELHRAVGRPLDTLLLQEQDTVGRRLGRGGGDEVMAAVAAAGRRISWAGDDAWARIRAWIEGPRRTRSGSRPRDLGHGVVRVDDEIAIAPGPTATTIWASGSTPPPRRPRWRVPFARDTLRRMTRADPAPLPDPWPAPARADFLALVGSGNGAGARLRRPRPRRPVDRAHPGVDGGAEPAATQRLPPLHRRSPPHRGGRPGGAADPVREPPGRAGRRRPAPRHREGLAR